MCRPSVTVAIPVEGMVTSPPKAVPLNVPLLSSLATPLASKKLIVPAAPVINSP